MSGDRWLLLFLIWAVVVGAAGLIARNNDKNRKAGEGLREHC